MLIGEDNLNLIVVFLTSDNGNLNQYLFFQLLRFLKLVISIILHTPIYNIVKFHGYPNTSLQLLVTRDNLE